MARSVPDVLHEAGAHHPWNLAPGCFRGGVTQGSRTHRRLGFPRSMHPLRTPVSPHLALVRPLDKLHSQLPLPSQVHIQLQHTDRPNPAHRILPSSGRFTNSTPSSSNRLQASATLGTTSPMWPAVAMNGKQCSLRQKSANPLARHCKPLQS